jgi:hypothetical protein
MGEVGVGDDEALAEYMIRDAAKTEALAAIARGRKDCGRPVSAGTAQQIARMVLIATGGTW